MDDGQRWQSDLNTVCTCKSGKVTCQANNKGKDVYLSSLYFSCYLSTLIVLI